MPEPAGIAIAQEARKGAIARLRIDVRADARTRLQTMADDVLRGLSSHPRSLPPKYFYDATGSQLFEAITHLPEYYLTRTENGLLEAVARDLMTSVAPAEIVELGSGYSRKTRALLAARGHTSLRYVPIDVDETTLAESAARLLAVDDAIEVHALVGDFERDLVHVPAAKGRRLVLFLGSTLGNLDPVARLALLARVRGLLRRGDALLLGVDLVKDRRLLEAAYNDAAGVTATFNRNILSVVNRCLGGDFHPHLFRHCASYNEAKQRIEMHLVAERAQIVHIRRLGLTIRLEAGDTIWTESAYKFTRAGIRAMLAAAGLRLDAWNSDAQARFALALASPWAPIAHGSAPRHA